MRDDLRSPALLMRSIALAAGTAPLLRGGWSTDDYAHVQRLLRHPTVTNLFRSPDPFGFYRPVAHATWRFDAWALGFNPVMWRVTNLIVHALVVLLAYAFARTCAGRPALTTLRCEPLNGGAVMLMLRNQQRNHQPVALTRLAGVPFSRSRAFDAFVFQLQNR